MKPKIDIRHLIKEMIDSDLENIRKSKLSRDFEKKVLIAGQEVWLEDQYMNF